MQSSSWVGRGIIASVILGITALGGTANRLDAATGAQPVGAAASVAPVWVNDFPSGQGRGLLALDGAGNLYVAGITSQSLPDAPEQFVGPYDAYVSKYSPTGSIIWAHLLNTAQGGRSPAVTGIAVDRAGDVILTGSTYGSLPGAPEPYAGSGDVFVAKFSASGPLMWEHLLGSDSYDESGTGVAADSSGNIYISGETYGQLPGSPSSAVGVWQVFVTKYSPSGSRMWVEQDLRLDVGCAGPRIVADGSGNPLVAVDICHATGAPDKTSVDIAKYSTDGSRQWLRTLPSNKSVLLAFGVATAADRAGNLLVIGKSGGIAYIGKFSPTGVPLWIRHLGNANRLYQPNGIALDFAGNAVIVGLTRNPNTRQNDAFVAKYAANGTFQWVRRLGTAGSDQAWAVGVDRLGNSYVTGTMCGQLAAAPETYGGGCDAFAAKYSPGGPLVWAHQNLGYVGFHVAVAPAGQSYISGIGGGGGGFIARIS